MDMAEGLLMEKKNGYASLSPEEREAMERYGEGYKAFLSVARTERLCVAEAVRLAEEAGFVPYERGMTLKPGDRIYRNNRKKMLFLAVIGTEDMDAGMRLTAAHADAPRLDLKPYPLYEDGGMAYMKTHYYGGIRKYQWVTIPLALCGVVAMKDGTTRTVSIGLKPGEPKLFITDLLPHLAQEQNKKTLKDGIAGEQLNLLVGTEPIADSKKDGVKRLVMRRLYEKYGITEEDFISAELSAVPALEPSDIGLDGSMIGGYGQDDRVCVYAVLKALLDLRETPRRTAVCVLADKEEIGSVGVTSMQTAAFDTFVEDLCADRGGRARVCLEHSFCMSADVTVARDPSFPEVFDERNAARLNYGVGLCKYTGKAGKSGASDASAEVVAHMRRILDGSGILWQMTELGKVDVGGGGTVALFLANRNIDTIDAGVPVLSMHAPYEITAKLDGYMTCRAAAAVYRD